MQWWRCRSLHLPSKAHYSTDLAETVESAVRAARVEFEATMPTEWGSWEGETARVTARCRALERALLTPLIIHEDQRSPPLHHGRQRSVHLGREDAPGQLVHALDGELGCQLLPVGPGGG